MRAFIGAFAALTLAAAPAAAQIDQSGWKDLKTQISLPNGQRVAYVEWGNPKGAPVVLLHGFTDTSRSWTQVLPSLSNFRVIVVDQRGHGAASKPECCYALADYAYDVKLLMDALKLERASVAGHSLGSMIALEFAATYPARIDKLVLAGATGLAPITYGDWLSSGALSVADKPDYENGFLAEWVGAASPAPSDGPTSVDEIFLGYVVSELRETPASVWRGVARELLDRPVARLAPYVSVSTFIMAGGKDDLFHAEHQAALRAALPQAEYREFEGLGHNLIWETPETVGPALAEFLALGAAGLENNLGREKGRIRRSGCGLFVPAA
jgi:pimeloyl-ACP methyl ester carboxylesterase